jgi:UrcA family protein
MTNMTKFAMISAALAATLFAGSAYAAPAQKAVSYADLNLASAAGAKSLETRVRNAAKQVCGVGTARDLSTIAATERCYDAAVNEASRAASSDWTRACSTASCGQDHIRQ